RFISLPYTNLTLPRDRIVEHERSANQVLSMGYSSISYHSHNVEEIELVFREIQKLLPLEKAEVLLDVGSGNGDVAAIGRRHSSGSRIWAFECDPLAIALCRMNFGARTDITFVDRAVGDAAGTMIIEAPGGAPDRGKHGLQVDAIALGD